MSVTTTKLAPNTFTPASAIQGSAARFRDINSGTGDGLGVDRNASISTTFTKLWKRNGSGVVFSAGITMESPAIWELKIIIDGAGGGSSYN